MKSPGALCADLPHYVRNPAEFGTVVFCWGVNEDSQLGLDALQNVAAPKVVDCLLGIPWLGRGWRQDPLVAGSRNSLAIDADGAVRLSWHGGGSDDGLSLPVEC